MSGPLPPAPAVVWLRNDLRVADNPALAAAAATGRQVLIVYVLDDASPGLRPLGGAAKWWLHHALAALAGDLAKIGGRLDLLHGPAAPIIERLATTSGAASAFWNRRYEKHEIAQDTAIEAALSAAAVKVQSFNASLLHEPWTIRPKGGGFFKVFGPFWRAVGAAGEVPAAMAGPRALSAAPYPDAGPPRRALAQLKLVPRRPDWAGGLRETWCPGEANGRERLRAFVAHDIDGYGAGRDRPGAAATSRLSPYLRFGEVSVRQVFHAAEAAAAERRAARPDVDKFQAELGWREFCYHLLFHLPDLPRENVRPRFDRIGWEAPDETKLAAWRAGRTGYPIVDAGMRELWQTGYMHNRVRLIAASFLVKHLLVDWRIGEAWFWDTLCDADPASNAGNWQWVAGSGADAAPYFRIFNPVLQGERFDPEGDYVRRFVPELSRMPSAWIHQPWKASAAALAAAQVDLATTYPRPIVDHAAARRRALEIFAALRSP